MRLYAYIVLGFVVVGLLGYGVHVVKKANRTEAAEKALEDAQERFAADVERLTNAAAINRQIAADLSLYRNEQASLTQTFREELSKRNITSEVHYVTEKGEQVTCTQRDPVRYRELFNQAVTGAAP